MESNSKNTGIFGDEWGTNEWFSNLYSTQGEQDPSAYYGHLQNGYQRRRHSVLISLLKDFKKDMVGTSILDVGCGGGELTNGVAKYLRTNKVVGLDFVDGVILSAQKKYPEFIFKADTLKNYPTDNKQFGLVIISEVLYYLSPKERNAYLENFSMHFALNLFML